MERMSSPDARDLPERLFVWGLVDSIEEFEDEVSGKVVSIDAMVSTDSVAFRKIRPEVIEGLRRIVFSVPPSFDGLLFRRFFDGVREGAWVRLRVTATGQGPYCEIEGPYPSLRLTPDGDMSGPHLYRARLRWGRLATRSEVRRLRSMCLKLVKGHAVASPTTGGGLLPGKIRILDAGQAHCAEIYDRSTPGKVLGYFDVGKPISFLAATWPTPAPVLNVPKEGFVFISHWDYDHYSMALDFAPSLQSLSWIAPIPVSPGPTVAALIKKLGASIALTNSAQIVPGPGLELYKGLGPPSNRNSSGYVLRMSLAHGDVLLSGDVDYQFILPAVKNGLKGMLAPHHGANLVGAPPAPAGGAGEVVFSFGDPNKYGHPHLSAIASHAGLGWALVATNWTSNGALAPAAAAPLAIPADFWF